MWANKHAIRAGDIRSLLAWCCRRNNTSSSNGKHGLTLRKYLHYVSSMNELRGATGVLHINYIRGLEANQLFNDLKLLCRGASIKGDANRALLDPCEEHRP